MKHNFFFSGNAAVSEACSAFVEMFLTERNVFGYFKVNWKSSFSVRFSIVISTFRSDLCIMSLWFELAEFPVQACTKQKSHTHCARSSSSGPSRITSSVSTNVTPSPEKKGFVVLKPKIMLFYSLYNCCQATEHSCGRADPLIAWSTLWSSAADA